LIRHHSLSAAEHGKEVPFEHETQQQNDDRPANTEMNSAEAETTAAPSIAAFIATILDVLAIATGCQRVVTPKLNNFRDYISTTL
jgi:hypothetical protein